ncbi:HPr family phosphocarrier protein [Streptomyces sp. V1I6]|jgi:phosphotransferase system HPr (HPr) family protein|uniref:HPr family phosphocarrier protein n=1 Tax=unclassified Streptomyces TaxID=2593676 RepID=UPI00277D3192|nr:HPr family phosphocarrier protein [Streptomyces sp. V1I6]MDQ0848015.1 phosphocarrier protein HPr [Streptomyces sp. V1I6]
MAQRVVSIGSRSGLHARPAATFVQAAAQVPVPVTIAADGKPPVPANSLLGVMTLGAGYGDQVTLTAEGDQAEAVLEELATLLSEELDA